MYAGTKVNWHEVLMADSNAAANNESLPLFLCAFSADKGTEDITDFVYKDFLAMYGNNADFFKHGQPLIQAHQILAAGGRVLGKRLVADDATLGNLIILANLTVDAEAETPTITVKYETASVANAKKFSEVYDAAEAMKSDTKFPLFVITDNGRGTSVKSVRINPDYDLSKRLTFMMYNIYDIEAANNVESTRFAAYPDAMYYVNGVRRNVALTEKTTTQFRTSYCKTGLVAFAEALAEATGYSKEEIYELDFLFGKTVNGSAALSNWTIDPEGVDITSAYGLALQNGTNGAFGDAPFVAETASDAWKQQAIKFFGGEFSDEIYDLDQHKIDFCVDANYPDDVKHKIVELANFREDFYYFRDLTTSIISMENALDKISESEWVKSPFVGDYCSVYDIIDNYSRKQITVTMTHGLAPLLVAHFSANIAAPIAGEFNNFIITEAIEGTLNFVPRITPNVDQKTIMDDAKLNYVNYSTDNNLVLQSTYTSQDHWGPLSYASNVIVTQMCIKAIRRYCPKIRFMLMDDTDFTAYKQLIENNVIDAYKQYFQSISLVYTHDDEMTAAKIFNASLKCYYRDFPQGEIFDVFAIEGSPVSNPF